MATEIQIHGYFIGTWDMLDEAADFDIDWPAGLADFKELLNMSGLDCLPKIVKGTVANLERSLIGLPIVFFRKTGSLKKHNSNVKYALLVGNIAAAMARIDGEVTNEEIEQVREDIYRLPFLSESEKYKIFIRSVYALKKNSSKEEIIKSFAALSVKAKKLALNIAKNIVIADHHINRNERFFLYELYRLCDLPTNTVDRDLKTHAREQNIVLETNRVTNIEEEPELVLEVDDSFDEMLNEFENF